MIELKDFRMGNNVKMGPNATISWGKVLDIPQGIVYDTEMTNYVANQLLDYIDTYTFNSELDKYALATDLANFITGQEVSTRFNNLLYYSNLDTILGQDYIITGKLAANQIASGRISSQYLATDISQVYRTLYVGGDTYDGTVILGSSFVDGCIKYTGEAIWLNAMSGVHASSLIQDGLIVTDDIVDSYIENYLDNNLDYYLSGYTMPYYSSNYCYVDAGTNGIVIRNKNGTSLGTIAYD